jgi:hypothetical protein
MTEEELRLMQTAMEEWRRTPASCGTPTCFKAISSFNDAVVSDMKTGFMV